MATLVELERDGSVCRYNPGLPPHAQTERLIYLLPRAQKWMEEALPKLIPAWTSEISPLEQLVIFLEDFCAGEELEYGQKFKHLRHVADFVWELKTADLRLFGWFTMKDCFIVARANAADLIKKHGLYTAIGDEVVRDCAQLDLNEPKYIKGNDPHVVVSNYYFP